MKTMIKKLCVIFGVLVFILSAVSGLQAQTTAAEKVSPQAVRTLSHPEWQQMVDELKAETKSLLDENEKLSSEYTSLQEKLSGLQQSLKALRADVSKQESENKYLKQKQQASGSGATPESQQKLEKEFAALQAKNEVLKKELAEVQERNSVWEKQLSSLQVQKRGLLLDMKLQEAAREGAQTTEDPELKQLVQQLAEAQEKSIEIDKTLQELSAQKQASPQDIDQLKSDNKALGGQLADLEAQRRQKEQENKKIEQENRSLAAAAQKGPADLEKRKKALEQQVVKLESQFDGLRKSVDETKAVLDRKRSLMDEIMKLDAENQETRKRIADMMQQISGLKDQDVAESAAPTP